MWQHGHVKAHVWQPQEGHFQLVVSVNGLGLLTEQCSGGSSEWLWWPRLHALAGGMEVIGPPEALFPIFSFPWGPQFGQPAGEGGAGSPAHFQVQGRCDALLK